MCGENIFLKLVAGFLYTVTLCMYVCHQCVAWCVTYLRENAQENDALQFHFQPSGNATELHVELGDAGQQN